MAIFIALTTIFTACGEVPENTKAPAKAAAPVSPLAERINKVTNVSFSTYSKDWPVGWQWIDPDEKDHPTRHSVKTGVLRVTIPTGKDLIGDNRKAPRYLKTVTGDFQIETRVKFLPKENYQGAGLLIYLDEDNYIRFERSYGGFGGGGEGIRFDIRDPQGFRPIVKPGEIQTGAKTVGLKIVRKGQQFTAYWRLDDNTEWEKAGEILSDYPDTVLIGLVACNTAEEITAEFAYIRLLPVEKH